jgi:nitroreductase
MSEMSGATTAGTDWVERLTAPRPEPQPGGPAPDDTSLARILAAAAAVPDHGSLRPWRFTVVSGAGQERFGQALVDGLVAERGPGVPDAQVAKTRGKAFAAACAVVLIASPDPTSNVPVWEQEASASCTGYAIVLAATGLGFGAVWKSAAVLDTVPVRELFELGPQERLLGWVNIGTPEVPKRDARMAPAPDLEDHVRRLDS